MIQIETITQFLNMFGFPIVVTLWFMFRTETILKQTSKNIQKNTETLISLVETTRKCQK